MGVEVRLNLGRRNGVGRRRRLARLLEQGVAEDLAHLLLGRRILVVALLARLVGEEHDVDHLAQQLAPPRGRRVPDAVELVHVLQRGDVVAEGDRAVADVREDLRRLLGRQGADGDSAVDGRQGGCRGT